MTARTVLCFGDSNTHGTKAMRTPTDRRRHAKEDRWPSVMAAALGAEWDVIAEGHPGRTAVFDDPVEGAHKNALRVLQAILETHRPIDIVVVMLGTNDMKARFGAAAHDVALGVQRVVTDVRRSECGPQGRAPEVLIAAPVILREVGVFEQTFAGAARKSSALPALLSDVAARQGAAFFDLNEVATVDPVDGIHLDAAAQAAIGAALAQEIKTNLSAENGKDVIHAERN